MRRVLDITCAVIGLVVLSPLFALIAVAIKIEDGGPIFYSQPRVGKDFRRFRLYKFRSMVAGADRLGSPLTGPQDPRITRVGRFLRRYKLDELPQLVNLLMGDMRLVGARPELERYVDVFRSEYTLLLRDRPGITDPASLVYRQEHQVLGTEGLEEQYLTEILPHKLELSLEYARRRTLLADLGIVCRTVFGIPWTPPDSHHSGALPVIPSKPPAQGVSSKVGS